MSLKCAGSRWHSLKVHCSIPASQQLTAGTYRAKHQQHCFIYELFINFIELINVFNSFFRAVITQKRSNTPTKQQKFSPHHPSVTNKKRKIYKFEPDTWSGGTIQFSWGRGRRAASPSCTFFLLTWKVQKQSFYQSWAYIHQVLQGKNWVAACLS